MREELIEQTNEQRNVSVDQLWDCASVCLGLLHQYNVNYLGDRTRGPIATSVTFTQWSLPPLMGQMCLFETQTN